MPAYNKRHRETTYSGIRLKPAAGAAGCIISGLLAFTNLFNGTSYLAGFLLAVVSLMAGAYAIYEVIHNDDWRVRMVKARAKTESKKRQTMQ